MIKKYKRHWPLAFVCITMSGVVAAQQQNPTIQIGESDLSPSVGIRYLYNSNAFLTPENETDTTAIVVAPSVEWIAQRRLLELSFVYDGEYAAFSEDALDYDDHRLSFDVIADLSTRQRVNASVTLSQEHEPLGTLLTRGIADENTEQVELISFGAEASFVYGARNAKGNVEAGVRLAGSDFTNQDDLTDESSFTRITPFAVFSYRLSTDSRLLLEGSVSDVNFDVETRDRSDVSALLGIVIGESQKTSGTASIGFSQASFDLEGRDDNQALIANVSMTWEPVDFSTFRFALSRGFNNTDSAVDGDLTIANTVRLDWTHNWSSRVSTEAFAANNANDRECPELDTSTVTAGFEVAFSVRRWLVMGAGVGVATRSSGNCPVFDPNQEDLDFDRETGNVFLRATL